MFSPDTKSGMNGTARPAHTNGRCGATRYTNFCRGCSSPQEPRPSVLTGRAFRWLGCRYTSTSVDQAIVSEWSATRHYDRTSAPSGSCGSAKGCKVWIARNTGITISRQASGPLLQYGDDHQ